MYMLRNNEQKRIPDSGSILGAHGMDCGNNVCQERLGALKGYPIHPLVVSEFQTACVDKMIAGG